MSGDYSRLSFDPTRDYSAVLAQQGRISTDADSLEQVFAAQRRVHTEGLDIVGKAVVPRETPDAFLIQAAGGALTIGPGRIYVDGLLAENHGGPPLVWGSRLAEEAGTAPTPYDPQPYLPDPPALPAGAGPHLVYLKIWQREVTAVDDPTLIEPALGIDTSTRLQNVWQVRVLEDVGAGVTCATPLTDVAKFNEAEPGAGGRLTTGTIEVSTESNPCLVPPGGGYKGLENQLYRIEIHRGGSVGGSKGARFKWSRDNGTVASRVTHIKNLDQLVVESLGRDEVLGFSDGDWVEVTDDWRELAGLPGEMRRIKIGNGVDEATRTITLAKALPAGLFPVNAQDETDPGRNTRVRRWDQSGRVLDEDGDLVVNLDSATADGTIPVTPSTRSVHLENGIVVTFNLDAASGVFRTGDWWCFAARATTGSIELLDKAPPRGIHAHYAPLSLVSFPEDETDCRVLVAPLDDRLALFYVSGDTQQAVPDVTNPATLVPLPHELAVGVANGGWPVAGAKVKFAAMTGRLAGSGPEVTVTTGADGLASVTWELTSGDPVQTASATLLNGDASARGVSVRFSATLSHAERVAYNPEACANLAGATSVQAAIDRLCGVVGDGCDTLSLNPGSGWVEALESLEQGSVATVCFRPGEYTADRPVTVRKLAHVALHGAGRGSSVVARGAEAALRFEECQSVVISDLAIAVESYPSESVSGQLGALTTLNCEHVALERVQLACPSGDLERAACLTVRSGGADADVQTPPATDLVRIRDCEFVVGHGQTGALVVNAERVVVTGCECRTPALGPNVKIADLLADPVRLTKAAMQIARRIVVDRAERVLKAGFNTAFKVGEFAVRLNSPVPEQEWEALVKSQPPSQAETGSGAAVAGYVERLVTRAAAQPANVPEVPSFARLVSDFTSRLSDPERFFESEEGRTAVRAMLAGHEIDVKPLAEAAAVQRMVSIPASTGAVRFDSVLNQQSWEAALRAMPAPDKSAPGIALHVERVARRLLQDAEFSQRIAPGLLDAFTAQNVAAAACGVRVGGSIVGEVAVERNSFRSTTEAVHVAASFRRSKGFPLRSVSSVRIRHNDIRLAVPFELEEAPRAIFVGNASRAMVMDNRSRVQARRAQAGVHIEGVLGPHAAVRDNELGDCSTGVLMVPHGPNPESALWLIADNLALGAGRVVEAPPQARVEGNIG